MHVLSTEYFAEFKINIYYESDWPRQLFKRGEMWPLQPSSSSLLQQQNAADEGKGQDTEAVDC